MGEQLNGELQREIRKFQEAAFPKIPKEIVEALLTTTERQVKSGIAAKAKHEGDSSSELLVAEHPRRAGRARQAARAWTSGSHLLSRRLVTILQPAVAGLPEKAP